MNTTTLREKVIDEINHLPDKQLQQLLDVIHSFPSIHSVSHEHNDGIHDYAGCWKDMPDEVYEDFISEIYERLKNVFVKTKKGAGFFPRLFALIPTIKLISLKPKQTPYPPLFA